MKLIWLKHLKQIDFLKLWISILQNNCLVLYTILKIANQIIILKKILLRIIKLVIIKFRNNNKLFKIWNIKKIIKVQLLINYYNKYRLIRT